MKAVRSVDRAIDILLNFRDAPVQGVAEIQQAVDLPRPTLYRILNTLERRGLLRASGEPRRYTLSHRFVELAHAWLRSIDVGEISEPWLQGLRERTGETVILFVPRDETSRIVVREVRSPQPLSYSRGLGFVAPLAEGAGGKVIAAHLPEARAAALERSLATARQREQLQADLDAIRRQGYFVASNELIEGATSIAAPLFGADGSVLGSIAVYGPHERLAGEARQRCIRDVLETAARISEAAGHTGGPRLPAAEALPKRAARRRQS